MHGPHTQALVSGNTIRNLRSGQANNLFIRAFVHSIIEYNLIEDGDRNWCSQTGYSGYHSILLGNTWRTNVPRRHNSGENMYEAGGATWHGPVAAADSDTLKPLGLEKRCAVAGGALRPDRREDLMGRGNISLLRPFCEQQGVIDRDSPPDYTNFNTA